jgi:serine/threonine-protein kinase OSR1/STK39
MKVLILTIQEDPPTLDTYNDDDDEVVDEDYSKQFRQFVDMCLQKNPSRRRGCQELLQSKYMSAFADAAVREERRERLKTQVCDLVRDVGEIEQEPSIGHTPVSFVLSKAEDRPAGTTWVFADGSQVLSSAVSYKSHDVDDVMAELDEFGKQTGGENYERQQQQQQQQQAEHQEDDLDAFMDEFEQNTAGENFRRKHH